MKNPFPLKWSRKPLIGLFLALAFVVGCNTPSWVNTAIQMLPTLTQAAMTGAQIYMTVAGNVDPQTQKVINQGFTEAGKDFSLAQTLIEQYKANPKSSAGLLPEISAALQDAQANLSQILPAVHVFNPALQAQISGIVSLILSQVQALEQVLPSIAAQKIIASAPVTLLTPSQFKAAFKAVSGHSL